MCVWENLLLFDVVLGFFRFYCCVFYKVLFIHMEVNLREFRITSKKVVDFARLLTDVIDAKMEKIRNKLFHFLSFRWYWCV